MSTKTNDWFAIQMLNEDNINALDFVAQDITADNTGMGSKDYYKSLDSVQKYFTNEETGKFDETAFNQAYDSSLYTYNQFVNTDYEDALLDNIEKHPNYWMDNSSKVRNTSATVSMSDDPYHRSAGMAGIWNIGDQNWSVREIAQNQKVKDENGNDLDWSPNDVAGTIKMLFKPTVALATYEENGIHEDIYGNQIAHKAGELKLNEKGEFYYETLNGKSPMGRDILRLTDILTVEGTVLNEIDIFDADSMDKSVGSTIMRTVASIAPLLTPAGATIGAIGAGINFASALPVVIKSMASIFGGNKDGNFSEAMNRWEGYMKRFSGTETDYSREKFMTFEKFGSQVVGIANQLYQQKSVAKIGHLLSKKPSIKAAKVGQALSTSYMAATSGMDSYDMFKEAGASDAVAGIGTLATMLAFGWLLSNDYYKSALFSEDSWMNEDFVIAQSLKNMGGGAMRSAIEATPVKPTTIQAQGLFMHWFTKAKNAIQKSFKKLKKANAKPATAVATSADDAASATASAASAAAGATDDAARAAAGTASNTARTGNLTAAEVRKKVNQALTTEDIKDAFGNAGAKWYNIMLNRASNEAVEEMMEEGIQDVIKGIMAAADSLGIRMTERDDQDLDFNFNFKDFFIRYLTAGVGGFIGGSIFDALDRYESIWSPELRKLSSSSISDAERIAFIIQNGGKNDLISSIQKLKKSNAFAPKGLSYKGQRHLDIDGSMSYIFETTENEQDTQNAIIADALIAYVNRIDKTMSALSIAGYENGVVSELLSLAQAEVKSELNEIKKNNDFLYEKIKKENDRVNKDAKKLGFTIETMEETYQRLNQSSLIIKAMDKAGLFYDFYFDSAKLHAKLAGLEWNLETKHQDYVKNNPNGESTWKESADYKRITKKIEALDETRMDILNGKLNNDYIRQAIFLQYDDLANSIIGINDNDAEADPNKAISNNLDMDKRELYDYVKYSYDIDINDKNEVDEEERQMYEDEFNEYKALDKIDKKKHAYHIFKTLNKIFKEQFTEYHKDRKDKSVNNAADMTVLPDTGYIGIEGDKLKSEILKVEQEINDIQSKINTQAMYAVDDDELFKNWNDEQRNSELGELAKQLNIAHMIVFDDVENATMGQVAEWDNVKDTTTGKTRDYIKIYWNKDNSKNNIDEMKKSLLHEAVGHYGLRKIFNSFYTKNETFRNWYNGHVVSISRGTDLKAKDELDVITSRGTDMNFDGFLYIMGVIAPSDIQNRITNKIKAYGLDFDKGIVDEILAYWTSPGVVFGSELPQKFYDDRCDNSKDGKELRLKYKQADKHLRRFEQTALLQIYNNLTDKSAGLLNIINAYGKAEAIEEIICNIAEDPSVYGIAEKNWFSRISDLLTKFFGMLGSNTIDNNFFANLLAQSKLNLEHDALRKLENYLNLRKRIPTTNVDIPELLAKYAITGPSGTVNPMEILIADLEDKDRLKLPLNFTSGLDEIFTDDAKNRKYLGFKKVADLAAFLNDPVTHSKDASGNSTFSNFVDLSSIKDDFPIIIVTDPYADFEESKSLTIVFNEFNINKDAAQNDKDVKLLRSFINDFSNHQVLTFEEFLVANSGTDSKYPIITKDYSAIAGEDEVKAIFDDKDKISKVLNVGLDDAAKQALWDNASNYQRYLMLTQESIVPLLLEELCEINGEITYRFIGNDAMSKLYRDAFVVPVIFSDNIKELIANQKLKDLLDNHFDDSVVDNSELTKIDVRRKSLLYLKNKRLAYLNKLSNNLTFFKNESNEIFNAFNEAFVLAGKLFQPGMRLEAEMAGETIPTIQEVLGKLSEALNEYQAYVDENYTDSHLDIIDKLLNDFAFEMATYIYENLVNEYDSLYNAVDFDTYVKQQLEDKAIFSIIHETIKKSLFEGEGWQNIFTNIHELEIKDQSPDDPNGFMLDEFFEDNLDDIEEKVKEISEIRKEIDKSANKEFDKFLDVFTFNRNGETKTLSNLISMALDGNNPFDNKTLQDYAIESVEFDSLAKNISFANTVRLIMYVAGSIGFNYMPINQLFNDLEVNDDSEFLVFQSDVETVNKMELDHKKLVSRLQFLNSIAGKTTEKQIMAQKNVAKHAIVEMTRFLIRPKGKIFNVDVDELWVKYGNLSIPQNPESMSDSAFSDFMNTVIKFETELYNKITSSTEFKNATTEQQAKAIMEYFGISEFKNTIPGHFSEDKCIVNDIGACWYLCALLTRKSDSFYSEIESIERSGSTYMPFYGQMFSIRLGDAFLKDKKNLFSEITKKTKKFNPKLEIDTMMAILGSAGTGKTTICANYISKMNPDKNIVYGANGAAQLNKLVKTITGQDSVQNSFIIHDLLKKVAPKYDSANENDVEFIDDLNTFVYKGEIKEIPTEYKTLFKEDSVFIIDECTLVDTRGLLILNKLAKDNKCKIILLGDLKQNGNFVSLARGKDSTSFNSFSDLQMMSAPILKESIRPSVKAQKANLIKYGNLLDSVVLKTWESTIYPVNDIKDAALALEYKDVPNKLIGAKILDDKPKEYENKMKEVVNNLQAGETVCIIVDTDDQKTAHEHLRKTGVDIKLSSEVQSGEWDYVFAKFSNKNLSKLKGNQQLYTYISRAKKGILLLDTSGESNKFITSVHDSEGDMSIIANNNQFKTYADFMRVILRNNAPTGTSETNAGDDSAEHSEGDTVSTSGVRAMLRYDGFASRPIQTITDLFNENEYDENQLLIHSLLSTGYTEYTDSTTGDKYAQFKILDDLYVTISYSDNSAFVQFDGVADEIKLEGDFWSLLADRTKSDANMKAPKTSSVNILSNADTYKLKKSDGSIDELKLSELLEDVLDVAYSRDILEIDYILNNKNYTLTDDQRNTLISIKDEYKNKITKANTVNEDVYVRKLSKATENQLDKFVISSNSRLFRKDCIDVNKKKRAIKIIADLIKSNAVSVDDDSSSLSANKITNNRRNFIINRLKEVFDENEIDIDELLNNIIGGNRNPEISLAETYGGYNMYYNFKDKGKNDIKIFIGLLQNSNVSYIADLNKVSIDFGSIVSLNRNEIKTFGNTRISTKRMAEKQMVNFAPPAILMWKDSLQIAQRIANNPKPTTYEQNFVEWCKRNNGKCMSAYTTLSYINMESVDEIYKINYQINRNNGQIDYNKVSAYNTSFSHVMGVQSVVTFEQLYQLSLLLYYAATGDSIYEEYIKNNFNANNQAEAIQIVDTLVGSTGLEVINKSAVPGAQRTIIKENRKKLGQHQIIHTNTVERIQTLIFASILANNDDNALKALMINTHINAQKYANSSSKKCFIKFTKVNDDGSTTEYKLNQGTGSWSLLKFDGVMWVDTGLSTNILNSTIVKQVIKDHLGASDDDVKTGKVRIFTGIKYLDENREYPLSIVDFFVNLVNGSFSRQIYRSLANKNLVPKSITSNFETFSDRINKTYDGFDQKFKSFKYTEINKDEIDPDKEIGGTSSAGLGIYLKLQENKSSRIGNKDNAIWMQYDEGKTEKIGYGLTTDIIKVQDVIRHAKVTDFKDIDTSWKDGKVDNDELYNNIKNAFVECLKGVKLNGNKLKDYSAIDIEDSAINDLIDSLNIKAKAEKYDRLKDFISELQEAVSKATDGSMRIEIGTLGSNLFEFKFNEDCGACYDMDNDCFYWSYKRKVGEEIKVMWSNGVTKTTKADIYDAAIKEYGDILLYGFDADHGPWDFSSFNWNTISGMLNC